MEKTINNSIYNYNQKIGEINQYQKEIKAILEIIKTKERELEEAHKMIKKRQDAIVNKEKEVEELKKSKEYRLDLIQQSQIVCKDNLMGIQEFIIYKQLIFCQEITKNFIVCPQVAIKAFIDNKERKESGDYEIFNRYKELYVDFLLVLKDKGIIKVKMWKQMIRLKKWLSTVPSYLHKCKCYTEC